MGLMWTRWIQLSLLLGFFVHQEQVSSLEAAVKLVPAPFCLTFLIGKAASSQKKLRIVRKGRGCASVAGVEALLYITVVRSAHLHPLIFLIILQPVIKSNRCAQFVQSTLLI